VKAERLKAAKAARLRRGRGASILTDERQFLQPAREEGRTTLG
jgi:hypothetical protein